MIDTIKELLEKNFLTILEKTPTACFVIADTVGHWHIDDFDIVWFNESAKQLFGNVIAAGKVTLSSNQQIDQILQNLQQIRQQLLMGQEGFIGPFCSTITDASGRAVRAERYILYLGEIGRSLATFLVVAHAKAAE